jgi:general secretion pathway protein D
MKNNSIRALGWNLKKNFFTITLFFPLFIHGPETLEESQTIFPEAPVQTDKSLLSNTGEPQKDVTQEAVSPEDLVESENAAYQEKADTIRAINTSQSQESATAPALAARIHPKNKKDRTKTITFRYNNESLIDVINFLAAQKEVNILLPQGADAITSKVTLSIDEKLSIQQAWELLEIILGIAGYSMLPKGDMFVIKKNIADVTPRELTKLYVGTKPEDLPNTEEQIQYVYFLANAKVTDDANNDLNKLLSELLPKDSYKVDPSTNGIIFSTKSNLIKSIMRIVAELDRAGFAEKMAIIRLRHANAELIAQLFREKILQLGEPGGFDRYRLDIKKQSDATYFSKNVRIIPEPRTNAIIVLGKAQAVERIQDFIYRYIDVAHETGKSILHIYQLQYLEADKAQDALNKVIESTKASATGQAKGGTVVGGTQRTFGDVIIQTDKTVQQGASGGESTEAAYGGNKLIIAARNDDWLVIKELIEKLDQPQPQVLIEVIIADLTLNDLKQLGASLRNPAKIPLPNQVQYQSADLPSLDGIVLNPSTGTPKSINADLLALIPPPTPPTSSQSTDLLPGSTAFSFNDNDGRTWCIGSILRSIANEKVLSTPHILATNNQQALVKLGQQRLLPDESVGTAGATTIKTKWIDASLVVQVTPRINSEAKNVTMKVDIDIVQYTNNTSGNRSTRKLVTNAIVQDKGILAIGGLLRTDNREDKGKTPILGDVPILGWFFKGHGIRVLQTNLMVFIQPIIVQPYLRGGISPETQKYINFAKGSITDTTLFDSLKDPVTRVFFKTGLEDADARIDKFVEKQSAKEATYKGIAQNTPMPNQNSTQVAQTTKDSTPRVQEKTQLAQNSAHMQDTNTQTSDRKNNQMPTKIEKNTPTHLASAPASIDKIRELVKDEQNPLRRIHG